MQREKRPALLAQAGRVAVAWPGAGPASSAQKSLAFAGLFAAGVTMVKVAASL